MRPFHCIILVLILSCLYIFTIFAQQSTQSAVPPAQRDTQALSAIQTAMQTLGGSAAWAQVQDATEQGGCTNNAGRGASSSQFTWTVQGYSFRYQSTASDGGQQVLASGHGKPTRSDGETTQPLSPRTASLMLPYQLPGVILAEALNDPTYSLRYVGSAAWEQAPAIQIEIARTFMGHPLPETTEDWYLAPQTMQPAAVTYFLPGEADTNHYAHFSYTYSGYQGAGGLSAPRTIVAGIVGTGFQGQCTVEQIQFNTSPPSSSFDLPLTTGGQN